MVLPVHFPFSFFLQSIRRRSSSISCASMSAVSNRLSTICEGESSKSRESRSPTRPPAMPCFSTFGEKKNAFPLFLSLKISLPHHDVEHGDDRRVCEFPPGLFLQSGPNIADRERGRLPQDLEDLQLQLRRMTRFAPRHDAPPWKGTCRAAPLTGLLETFPDGASFNFFR